MFIESSWEKKLIPHENGLDDPVHGFAFSDFINRPESEI